MKKGCDSKDVVALFRFMRLFEISLFSILAITDRQIKAAVAWEDDCRNGLPEYSDLQEIVLQRPLSDNIDMALNLGEYIYDNGWISIDKITISLTMLQRKINWTDNQFQEAIETLLSFKVSMVDNGKEGDSFYLHL